jgi:hypothetical protein
MKAVPKPQTILGKARLTRTILHLVFLLLGVIQRTRRQTSTTTFENCQDGQQLNPGQLTHLHEG